MATRWWGVVGGRYVEITEAESMARFCAPADGVYDEEFRRRRRQHLQAVEARFHGTRPGEAAHDA